MLPSRSGGTLSDTTTQPDADRATLVLLVAADRDDALLDVAVAEINNIYAAKTVETARAIGEYVLATFFAGDLATYRSRWRDDVSFRALARREDLRVSYSFIANAVAVVDQLRVLPADIASSLPLTHQKLLLPLKSEAAKVDLARRAVEEKLPTRALAAEVRRVRDQDRSGPSTGRPPLPAFAKALGQLKSVRELAASEPITRDVFSRYSPEKAAILLEDVEASIAALQDTAAQVRAAIDAWGESTGVTAR